MSAPKAQRMTINDNGVLAPVDAYNEAPPRMRAKVSLAEWQASKRAPVGFFARVWGR